MSEGVPSLLDTDVCEGDASGLLVLYSLSKQSNLAGYRGALIYGDPALVAPIVSVRKHSGLMVPAPVQHAMAVALKDTEHVERQRSVYAVRRALLLEALTDAGLDVDPDTAAGLYQSDRLVGPREPPGRARHPRGPRRLLRHGSPRACPRGPDRHRRAYSGGRQPHPRGLDCALTREPQRRGRGHLAQCARAAPASFVEKLSSMRAARR